MYEILMKFYYALSDLALSFGAESGSYEGLGIDVTLFFLSF